MEHCNQETEWIAVIPNPTGGLQWMRFVYRTKQHKKLIAGKDHSPLFLRRVHWVNKKWGWIQSYQKTFTTSGFRYDKQ
jgi:hypothetical protein